MTGLEGVGRVNRRLSDENDEFRVGGELSVIGVKGRGTAQGLGDQQSVEWVSVVWRKVRDASGDFGRDWPLYKARLAGPLQDLFGTRLKAGSIQRLLDRNLPDARGAELHGVGGVLQRIPGCEAQSVRLYQSPQQDIRVQEQIHSTPFEGVEEIIRKRPVEIVGDRPQMRQPSETPAACRSRVEGHQPGDWSAGAGYDDLLAAGGLVDET